MKIRAYTLSLVFFIMLIVSLSGCMSSSDRERTPAPTPAETTSVAPTMTSPVTTYDGLTYEEYIRNNPPPPRNLIASRSSGSIILRWDIPEKVKLSHNYSDIIVQYKIYRGTKEQDISYLTSAVGLTYRDTNISNDQKYIYEITAVHEGSMESVPSQEVTV